LVDLKNATLKNDLVEAGSVMAKIEHEVELEKKLRAHSHSARGPYAKWGSSV